MKVFLTLIFLCYFLAIHGQDTIFVRYDNDKSDDEITYVTDTIIKESGFDSPVLTGTTILPWTLNQQITRGYGINFDYVIGKPCEQNGQIDLETDKVLEMVRTDSTWIVRTKIIGNCCHDFLCDVKVTNDSMLSLQTIGYGDGYCACACCFEIEFGFLIDNFDNLAKVKYIMINDDEKTIYKMD